MSVYFAHAPELGMVKIGYADDAEKRFAQLQTASPTRLVLLAIQDGGRAEESALHKRFKSARMRGEWFHYASVAEHIEALQPYIRVTRRKPLAGPLGAWLIESGHTLETFGAVIGRSKGTVSGIINRGICPPGIALEIEMATGGKVSASELSPVIAEARAA